MEYDEKIIKERVHSNLLCIPSALFQVEKVPAIQAVSPFYLTGKQRPKSLPTLHGLYVKPLPSRRLLHWLVRLF
jgi:hypothetical protein